MQSNWTFVSNHALVLATLEKQPGARQRDIAGAVGITRGAVQRILQDLVDSGHVNVTRVGRRNHYRINHTAPLRHRQVDQILVADLLAALLGETGSHTNSSSDYAA